MIVIRKYRNSGTIGSHSINERKHAMCKKKQGKSIDFGVRARVQLSPRQKIAGTALHSHNINNQALHDVCLISIYRGGGPKNKVRGLVQKGI